LEEKNSYFTMQESYYWDLAAKVFSGKATDAQKIELENWINITHKNKEDFELQKELWDNTQMASIDFNTDERWIALEEQIRKIPKTRMISIKPFVRIAASVVLLIALVFSFKFFILSDHELIKVKSTSAKMYVELPDHSFIWLNANSELIYPKRFEGNERRVQLQGEGYFEITKNKEKPFVIDTEDTETKVLGTSFNIRAMENEPEVEVTVATGKVLFSSDEQKAVTLLPGERAVFNKTNGKILKEEKIKDNFLAWKTGVLKFENAPVTQIIHDLERFYKMDFICKNPEINNCKITTTFQNQTLEEVMQELQILLDIKFVKEKSSIVISGRGC
jgi:transmembrane sensor